MVRPRVAVNRGGAGDGGGDQKPAMVTSWQSSLAMSEIKKQIVMVLTCTAALAMPACARAGTCLKYEPTRVVLSGTISTKLAYGPPGYGEDPAHDARERYLNLTLDNPICVDSGVSPNDDSERNERSLQMVFFDDHSFQSKWMGQHVAVTGTLFHAISGHHHTKVLIIVNETHIISSSQDKN
jgi:hypothetical protein